MNIVHVSLFFRAQDGANDRVVTVCASFEISVSALSTSRRRHIDTEIEHSHFVLFLVSEKNFC